jgi:hypothetical protein
MPIDFFTAPCAKVDGNCKKPGIVCKTTTNVELFGLSDSNSDRREPAFLDIGHVDIWDILVHNRNRKDITFKAVDFCVDIYRVGNELIKRCEGFLYYDNKIQFVELKNRKKGRWLSDAREKFEETISRFMVAYPDQGFEILDPLVSNQLFPRVHQNEMVQKRMLKDSIGLQFRVETEIVID